MLKFKSMFLNPRYGVVGMISYPYWLIAEMLAPIMEFGGIICIILFTIIGLLNWPHAILLLGLIYLLSVVNSFTALLVYYLNFRKYNTNKDLLALFKTALLEPFVFHPKAFKWSLQGYRDYFSKKNIGWGKMTRVGYNTGTQQ